jgi:hypothetical protein
MAVSCVERKGSGPLLPSRFLTDRLSEIHFLHHSVLAHITLCSIEDKLRDWTEHA